MVHLIPSNSKYVLDGLLLLHKLQWTIGHTFAQIFQVHVTCIKKLYGNCATVVFGREYDAASTKNTDM